MHIAFVEIQNFRKLKACRVEIAQQETIFVGANNSGKTSAMDALILFLEKSRRKDFATTDFTLSNWSSLDQLGTQWVDAADDEEPDIAVDAWLPCYPPSMSGLGQTKKTFTVSYIFSPHWIGRPKSCWESGFCLHPRTWTNSTGISEVLPIRHVTPSQLPPNRSRRCLYGHIQ